MPKPIYDIGEHTYRYCFQVPYRPRPTASQRTLIVNIAAGEHAAALLLNNRLALLPPFVHAWLATGTAHKMHAVRGLSCERRSPCPKPPIQPPPGTSTQHPFPLGRLHALMAQIDLSARTSEPT